MTRPDARPAPGSPDGARPSAARLTGIHKHYGSLRAVDGVDFEVRAGEIHALLGENGAGKSTLMKVLAGMVEPDAGELELGGQAVRLRNRRHAARLGIGVVQQHFAVIEELTGVENLLLGNPHGGALADREGAARQLVEQARQLGRDFDPRRKVADMTMGERQSLEILIALCADPTVLILDEPTAALGGAEVGALGDTVRRLAANGMAIAYITHKLDEVMELSDRVTVMRRGRVVLERDTARTSAEELAEALIGQVPERYADRVEREPGAAVVGLHGVATEVGGGMHDIEGLDLTVRRGEIVGVAGVVGNGQDALADVLTGAHVPSAGRIDPTPAVVGYIPEDRARLGLADELSVLDNTLVHVHRAPELRRWGFLRGRACRAVATDVVARAQLTRRDVDAPASTLSGGNQQRLVITREFDRDPELIVAHNPYRGLDVGAITEVHRRLVAARDGGVGVVVISPDLEDLFGIADRIVVLFGGRIVGEVEPDETSAQELGKMMAGAR